MFSSCKFQDPASQAATRLNTIKIPSHSIAGKCTALTCKTVCNRYGRAMSKRNLHNPEIIALQNQGIVALLHNQAIDWAEAKEAQPGWKAIAAAGFSPLWQVEHCSSAHGQWDQAIRCNGAYERVRPEEQQHWEISVWRHKRWSFANSMIVLILI